MPKSPSNPLAQISTKFIRIFDNLSVRSKLFVYGGTVIGLIIGLALFSLYQVIIITEQQIPARVAARDMASALLTMHIKDQQLIAEADSPSSEFYLKRESSSFKAWQENYQKLNDSYDKIIKLYNGTGIATDLQTIKPKLEEYQKTFQELTGAFQQRGFQSFGRVGALQIRVDALRGSLSKKPQTHLALLQLIQIQDDFFLHPELRDVEDFTAQAALVEKQLTNNEDRILFNEYETLFYEVTSLYERIGFTATNGLRGEISLLLDQVSPQILSTEAAVVDLTSNKITTIFESVFIVTAFIIVVGTIMAFGISHLITRRLTQLLQASSRIKAGDLSRRLNVASTDELGHLANTFDEMVDKLAHNRQTLHERAQALSESVRRFELVSKAVNEAVHEWDLRTDVFNWGDGLSSEFGYDFQDRNTNVDWWIAHIHPDDAQSVNNSLTAHFRRHTSTWKAEYRFRKANGQYAFCQDRGFIEYHNGNPIRVVGSLVDITRQKELDRAKDEFISIASHQLRTPLGSIRWNLDLLLEESPKMSKDAQTFAREAHTSTMRMLGLVGDLLSVARIEQNRVQTMPVPTELASIIMLAVGEIKPLAAQRKVRINTDGLKKQKTEIIIDPKQFREVIQNLLSNAVKYTPAHGDVTVDIKAQSKDVLISIADSGIGIPDDDQHNLFGKFFRAHNVTTTDTEGSGLGLFVVKSYVQKWGGKIWFTSKVGEGTTFFISIPRRSPVQKPKS